MPSIMSPQYHPVHSAEDTDDEIRVSIEKESLLRSWLPMNLRAKRWPSRFWLNSFFFFNAMFSATLFVLSIILLRQTRISAAAPEPPYSPLREDGIVRYLNTEYKPTKIFQSSPSDEVDEAWDGWLREHDHLVLISTEKAKEAGLPESVETYNDPGYAPYGLGVYHQLHCLNRIRKSFYPDRYYPGVSAHELEHHTNHCFDVLRQAILCHGDVSLVYWWNRNYSYVDETGTKHYTPEYLQKTPEERLTGSFVKWDSPVQCRDMDAVNSWVKAHMLDDDKYGGQVVD